MTGPRRRPGRPPKAVTSDVIPSIEQQAVAPPSAPVEGGVVPETSTATSPVPEDVSPRRRRKSVGSHALRLSAPSRPGFKRRFFNDDGNRIAEAEELGYTPVSDTKAKTSGLGSSDTRLVGTKATGEPLRSVLMETPDELYAEGEAEKEAANQLIDEAITAGRDSTGRSELRNSSYGHGSITTDR